MQNYPRIGAGVVVFKNDHILLIQRGNAPAKGSWSIPGGRQELGEKIADTASREVKEETGVSITQPVLLETVDLIERDENEIITYHYTLIDFTADWLAGDLCAGDDALQAVWVNINDLESYKLWGETARVIKLAMHFRNKEAS